MDFVFNLQQRQQFCWDQVIVKKQILRGQGQGQGQGQKNENMSQRYIQHCLGGCGGKEEGRKDFHWNTLEGINPRVQE